MGAFRYRAIDAGQRLSRGLLDAESPRQARTLLRERGLIPLEVTAAADSTHTPAATTTTPAKRLRLSVTELALLTRQLATLIRAGLPLEQALSGVGAGAPPHSDTAALMMALRTTVAEGHSLAVALGAFPRIFPDIYRATVAAGEQSGRLAPVFERLAEYSEARQALRRRVLLALLYPAILTTLALVVVTGLLTWVVPQIVQVFDGIGQQLPSITLALIAVSRFLRETGGWLLLALALSGLGLHLLWRRPRWRQRFDAALLRLPLLGRLLAGLDAARYTRTFSILVASSVPVLEALRISAQVIVNRALRAAIETTAGRVREGQAIHRALADSGLFPVMTVQLIATGEASGQLATLLEQAALQQEREAETRIAVLLGVFEPALILIMGVVVLAIVLAILLPIFDLNQLVH